jgi:hypothetical protein
MSISATRLTMREGCEKSPHNDSSKIDAHILTITHFISTEGDRRDAIDHKASSNTDAPEALMKVAGGQTVSVAPTG